MSDPGGAERGARKRFAELFQQFAGAMPDVSLFQEYAAWGPRSTLELVVEAVRARLVGRRIDTAARGGGLSFTLSALDAKLDPVGLTAGQAHDVAVTAENVEYVGTSIERVTARLRNLHTRMGSQPTLVSAPVDLTIVMSIAEAGQVVERYIPWLEVSCVDAGNVRLRWRQHPGWGWLDAGLTIESGRVTLRPRAVGWGRWHRVLKRRWGSWTLPLALPRNTRVVAVDVAPGGATIEVRVDEWRVDYQQILGLATSPE